jgi:hypothetical protein
VRRTRRSAGSGLRTAVGHTSYYWTWVGGVAGRRSRAGANARPHSCVGFNARSGAMAGEFLWSGLEPRYGG